MVDKEDPKETISLDLGFGGLFKGLGNLLDLIPKLAEAGQEVSRTGEFKVKGLGEQARGVYGFSIRTGIGGTPQVESFGNIRTTESGPVVADVREPLVDVFDEANEILIVAELPGVSEEEIQVTVREDILSLETTGAHKYAKEILLSAPVDPMTLAKVYKNGILEVRVKRV